MVFEKSAWMLKRRREWSRPTIDLDLVAVLERYEYGRGDWRCHDGIPRMLRWKKINISAERQKFAEGAAAWPDTRWRVW